MGAYVRDKNTSARVCTKNAGGGGAYLRDTTVLPPNLPISVCPLLVSPGVTLTSVYCKQSSQGRYGTMLRLRAVLF